MNKIVYVSRGFRVFFQIALCVLPIMLAAYWMLGIDANVMTNSGFSLKFIPDGVRIMHALTPENKLMGFLIDCVPTALEMLILYFLIKLFRLYERGEIFTSQNVKYIRNIGYTLLVKVLINPFYQIAISLAMTINNPHGQRTAFASFGSTDIAIIITALLIILVSWIMAEGCKLREEQNYII